jgi:hypothetical protein
MLGDSPVAALRDSLSPQSRTHFAWMTYRDIKEKKTQAAFVEAASSLGDSIH